MTCAELLRRLDADEPLDAAQAREHAAGCASCRAALERWRAASGELRRWHAEPAPPFLHARIMTSVRTARAPRPWWKALVSPARPAWAVSALATVFLAVVGGLVVWHGYEPVERQPPAQATVEADAHLERLGYLDHGAPAEQPPPPARSTDASLVPTEAKRRVAPAAAAPPDREEASAPPVGGRAGGRLAGPEPPAVREAEALAAASRSAELERRKQAREESVAAFADEARARGYAPEPPAPGAPPPPAPVPVPSAPDETLGLAEKVDVVADAAVEGARQDVAVSSGLAAPTQAPASIRCRVTPLDGGATHTVSLPGASAPAPGEAWQVVIDAHGHVSQAVRLGGGTDPRDAVARKGEERRQATRAASAPAFVERVVRALGTLALPEGRYHVQREE